MVLKVFLIASSVQLLSVLGVAPRQTQSNILADLRTKHSLAEDKVTTDDSTAHHDQSSVIENVLKQLFQGRKMGGELEQISSEEFSKLFGSDKRTLQIQNANGKDTGIQYDFIPHVESESVPESATYTFFLRTGEPILFLFDPTSDDPKERNIKGSETKRKNSPRKPKVQSSFEGDGGVEHKEEHESKKDTDDLTLVKDTGFTKTLKNPNTFIEEDRQSKIPNVRKLPIADISSLLDDSKEEIEEEENEIDVEFSTPKLDLKSIGPILNKRTGQTQLEDEEQNSNSTSKEAMVTGPNSVDVEEVSTKALEIMKTISEESITKPSSEVNKSSVSESVDISNQNIEDAKDLTASLSQETSVTAEREEREKNGKSNITTDQTHTFIFENINENLNKTTNDILEIDNEEEAIIEETTKEMISKHDNTPEEQDTANESESTITTNIDDNNNTLQLEISNNSLNQEALPGNDEHMADLVIENLKRKLLNGMARSADENEGGNESRSGSWLKAIPFLAYWAVNYIRSDPRFVAAGSDENEEERAQAISVNIEKTIQEFREGNNSGEFDTSLYDVTENLTGGILNIANRNEVNVNDVNEKSTSLNDISIRNKQKENDFRNEIDLDRDIETEENQNSNFLASKPNPCNCEHGGECISASRTCYCSHGFTGIKCEQQIRKALVVGGLKDFQIHPNSELVGGLDDRRCSPPAFPTPIMAATGQTDRDTVVVCGGATQIGASLTPTNRCHLWANSDSWSPPLFMSSSRAWSASVLTPASQMVVFGGVDQNNVTLDSIEVIDIKTRKSIKIGLTLPSPLAGHCAVQLNSSHTFVAGGAVTGLAGFGESVNFSNQAWILSEAGWTAAGHLAQARSVHSCSTVVTRGGDVEVLVVGGIGLSRAGTRMVLDSVDIYNAATGRWRKGDKLPYPVFGAGLLELAGQPLLIGGRYQVDDQLLQSDDIFIYQHSWRSSALKMRSPRDQAVTVAAPPGC